MQLHHSFQNLRLASSYVTIGSFDGVHIGHQAVIRALVQTAHAESVPAVVITFHPHPAVVLRGITGPFYLTNPEERATLIANLGVDHVIILPFDHVLAQKTAHNFMQECVEALGMCQLWAGFDFKLGKDREGTPTRLAEIGLQLGYHIHTLPPFELQGEPVSSSLIRQLLSRGEVGPAATLLGRYYHLEGEVVHGDGRGKEIGIPTANLHIVSDRLLPMRAVYATRAWLGDRSFQSVTNIGFRPTFDKNTQIRIETHILDFDELVYHQHLKVEFIQQLRSERRYLSRAELSNQIKLDINQARKVLSDAR